MLLDAPFDDACEQSRVGSTVFKSMLDILIKTRVFTVCSDQAHCKHSVCLLSESLSRYQYEQSGVKLRHDVAILSPW